MLSVALQELHLKTVAHGGWGFGKFERWDLIQDEGILRFSNPDGPIVRASAQIVGTLDSESGTWLWSWANPSIAPGLTNDAQIVRRYGQERSIPALVEPEWKATGDDAWKMTAIAVKVADAQGAYRGVSQEGPTFIAFRDIWIQEGEVRRKI
jgi:hypothetical protein